MYKGTRDELLALAVDVEGLLDRNANFGMYGAGLGQAYASVLDLIQERLTREDG